MKFCSLCGVMVVQCILDGDNCLCYVCDVCYIVYYQNLCIVVGSLLVWDGQVLFCCCVIVLCLGYWMLLVGFMENGEIFVQVVVCEIEEEVNVWISDLQFYIFFDLLYISQVYLFFCVELFDLDFFVGDESLEVWFFDEVKIFWLELVFLIIGCILECYFSDCCEGCFLVCNEVIVFMLVFYKKD